MERDEVLAVALSRGECVLEKDRTRRVVLLDGKNVIVEGVSSTKHLSRGEAEGAFTAAIEAALADGFLPTRRDPPKALPFVQPTRPAEVALPPRASPPRRAAAPVPTTDWILAPPALQVIIDPFDGPKWEPLFDEQPEGISFVDLEGEFPDDAIELIAERGLPSWVTGLGLMSFSVVEDYVAARLDPAPIWKHFEQLRTLELRAGQSITIPTPLPRLSQLSVVTSEASPAVLEQLCEGSWPELTALELFLDATNQLTADDVLPALRLDRLPRLAHLAIRGVLDGEHLVTELRERGLRSLVVSHSDDDGGFGTSPFLEPDGIEVLSEDRLYPLRSPRFAAT